MVNFDGLWEVRAFYTVNAPTSLNHRMTVDVIVDAGGSPGDTADFIEVRLKSGAVLPLDAAMDDYFSLVWKLFGSGTSQPRFELWKYDPEPSKNATFITAWEPNITYDLGLGSPVPAHQATLTFRTQGGHTMRIQAMEGKDGTNGIAPLSFAVGDIAAIRDYVISPLSPVVGRDNTYLIAGINQAFGQNEKLARKRYRPT